jgi:predicted alpha/beta hydrolase family esterase
MKPLRLLTVPGYTGSGPGHWQTLWERAEPRIRRIEQRDWDNPEPEAWASAIEVAVRATGEPVVLVAHSCGVTAVAHWAARFETTIAGAFLVAPPDSERQDLDPAVRAFAAPVLVPLPFPALMVASESDPYCDFTRAGCIGGQSWTYQYGLGPWPLAGRSPVTQRML